MSKLEHLIVDMDHCRVCGRSSERYWENRWRDEKAELDRLRAEVERLREALEEIKRLNEMSGFNGCAIAEVYSKHLSDQPKETK